jgi:hypothetical protein
MLKRFLTREAACHFATIEPRAGSYKRMLASQQKSFHEV